MSDLIASHTKRPRPGQPGARRAVSNRIIALEPRFMFDAAGVAVASEGAAHQDIASPEPDHAQPAADPAFLDALAQSVPAAARADSAPAPAVEAPVPAPAPDGAERDEVMFVDPTVANYETLVDGARPGVEVVVLDPSRDGLVQMAEYLDGRSGIDSIQIMAHGSAGRFALGAIDVNADTLQTHGAELAAIGRALTVDGDILIYACNTGAGIDGQAFVIDLATATGADVAASSDNTGAAALGGNWALETRAGTIEATVALTEAAQDSYDALMTATFTLQAGTANPISVMGTVGTKTFVAADFDGDGDSDFIFRNNSASPTGVDFWRNDNGVFTKFSGAVTGNPFSAITWSGPNSTALAAGFSPFSMVATDVDGDGDIDVVNMASANGKGIWLNNSGIFTFATNSPTLPTVTANTQSLAGDFDGDGDIDVILRNQTAAPSGVDFWRNDGGTFTRISGNVSANPFSAITFAASAPNFDARFMAAGDVDGDGDIDVINMTATANPGRGIWLNNSGVFSIVSAGCLPVASASGQFAAGDFDGDGDTDIAFRNGSGTAVDFYRASGGTFALAISASPFSAIIFCGGANANFNYDLMTTVDIDGDGDLDIANFANSAGRGVFLNNLTPPKLTSAVIGGVTVSSADNPAGVGATPTITLTFDKTIQSAGAGKISIHEYGTGTLVGSAITATDTTKVSGVGSGSTITVTPGITLSAGTRYYLQIDKGAFFDADGATVGRVDLINNATMGLTSKTLFDFTASAAPTLDLNGSGTAGTGNVVTLAAAASGLAGATATAADAENDSATWNGATLTVKRTATAGTANGAWSSDVFGFTGASGITIDSGDLKSGSTIIGTATNSGGTLTIAFNGSATTALVASVVKGVTYANSTPAGNATITFALADGSGFSTSADVSVTSSDIYVTTTTDTATVDATGGISFSEAVAIANAQSGADTLIMGSAFTGAMSLAGNLTVSENLTVNADSAGGWTVQDGTRTITINSGITLTVTNSTGAVTIGSILSGAGGLTKAGPGTLTLTGNNGFTGAATVSAGELAVNGTSGALNDGVSVTVASGATLTIAADETIAALSGAGTLALGTRELRVGVNGDSSSFSGAITGSGTVTQDGTGTLALSGASGTQGWGIQVYDGTLSIAAAGNLGTGSVELNGATLSVTGDATLANAITLNGGGGTVSVGSGIAVALSGALTGSGALTKTGSGTLTLSNSANSFSGTTTVSAGTLLVTGALTGTTTVSVASGATLGGTGSITASGGVTIDSGATLAAGVAGTNHGIGTLTINGNLQLSGGLAAEVGGNGGVGGTDFDQVVVNGTVSLNGGSLGVSRVNGYTANDGTVFRVIDNDSTDAIAGSPGTFGAIAEGTTTTTNGDLYIVRYSAGTGNDVTLTAVTNPTVSSVSATTADGSYKAGDTIAITVTFKRSVTVTGTPTLALGNNGRTAAYSAGSGGAVLTFTYMVQAGDASADLDYLSTSALSLNGGSIVDSHGLAALLTLATPGAANSLGANKGIVIDTAAPGTPSAPDMTAGTDSGASSADNVTSNETPTFTGTAEANSTVTLYDTDGTTVIGSGTADGAGNWSITVSALSSGAHTITAKATDAAGNTSAASSSRSAIIDTTAPAVSSVTSSTADGTYKAGDSIVITVTFSEAVTVTGTPTLALDTGRTATYSGGSGSNALTFIYTVQPGDASADLDYASTSALSGTAADAAGNGATLTLASPGASGSLGAGKTIVIDTTPPPAPAAPALAPGSDTGTSSSDLVTSANRPTLTGTAEPGATVTILIDGVPGGTATAGAGGAWSFTPSAALADGVRAITATATDAAGNIGPASGALALTIDTTPPVLSAPGLAAGSDNGSSTSDRLTSVTRPTLTGTAEAGSAVSVILDGIAVGTTTAGTDGTWSFTVATTLADGVHSVQATATDRAGNVGQSSSQTFTVQPGSTVAVVPTTTTTSPTTTTGTGNGPSTNTSSTSSTSSSSTSTALTGNGSSGAPSLPGGGSSGSDAGRSVTLVSVGGSSSSSDAGRSVTLTSLGGSSSSSDAGRSVTLSSVGGLSGGVSGSGSSGLSGGTGSSSGGGAGLGDALGASLGGGILGGGGGGGFGAGSLGGLGTAAGTGPLGGGFVAPGAGAGTGIGAGTGTGTGSGPGTGSGLGAGNGEARQTSTGTTGTGTSGTGTSGTVTSSGGTPGAGAPGAAAPGTTTSSQGQGQGSAAAGTGQGGTLPNGQPRGQSQPQNQPQPQPQNQPQNQPDGAPANNQDGDQGGADNAPAGSAPPARGAGEQRSDAGPAGRSAPGFADQIARAHGGPANASALLTALASLVSPASRAA